MPAEDRMSAAIERVTRMAVRTSAKTPEQAEDLRRDAAKWCGTHAPRRKGEPLMTGRERLHNILNRKPLDRLSWTTLIDSTTQSAMPEPTRSMTPLEFYRWLGCDILQFGSYGLPKECRVQPPARAVWPQVTTERTEQPEGSVLVRNRTPWGTLVSASRRSHPVKHAVASLDDLRVLKNVWQDMRYEEVPGHEESFRRVEALIGDRGMYVPTISPSPVQQLIETDMGQVNFYFLLQDHPEEMQELL